MQAISYVVLVLSAVLGTAYGDVNGAGLHIVDEAVAFPQATVTADLGYKRKRHYKTITETENNTQVVSIQAWFQAQIQAQIQEGFQEQEQVLWLRVRVRQQRDSQGGSNGGFQGGYYGNSYYVGYGQDNTYNPGSGYNQGSVQYGESNKAFQQGFGGSGQDFSGGSSYEYQVEPVFAGQAAGGSGSGYSYGSGGGYSYGGGGSN
ncbi:hypothetical protein GGH96_000717 [Coemansia sp. RSA 1972]|nr:hypothetical protein GGH96_000717 [Coemansia sp. RSA 1972]